MKLSNTGHRASLTKRQLQTRYTKEAKARLRRAVEEVRSAKREARKQRTTSAPRLRSLCRGSVKRARIRGRALVQAALDKSRAEARALVETARKGCDRRKEKELRAKGRHIAALELEAERAKERFIAERLGGALERQARALKRTTPKERAQESDDEVRRNLPPELVPVFDSVKKSIRATAGKSRTEAFEEWAEENADEVAARFADQADRETQKMIRQLEQRDRLLREMLKRDVVLPSDLLELNVECADVESLGLSCDDAADVGHAVDALSKPRQRIVDFQPSEFEDDAPKVLKASPTPAELLRRHGLKVKLERQGRGYNAGYGYTYRDADGRVVAEGFGRGTREEALSDSFQNPTIEELLRRPAPHKPRRRRA